MSKNTFQEIAEKILGANPQPALFDSRECEDKVLKYSLVLAERKVGATDQPGVLLPLTVLINPAQVI